MLTTGRFKTVLLLGLIPVVVYLAVLNISDRLDWKTPADGLAVVQTEEGLVVKNSRLSFGGIHAGDRLIDISGVSVRNHDDYTEILEALATGVSNEFVADYTFRKANSSEEITIPLKVRLEPQFGGADAPLLVVAVAFLAVGVLILLRARDGSGAHHFSTVCLLAFLLVALRYSGRADTFDIVVYWTSAAALLLLPPVFLHFCINFPARLSQVQMRPGLTSIVYLPAGVIGLLHITWFMGRLQGWGIARTPSAGHLIDKLEIAYFVGAFVVAAFVLLAKRHQLNDSVARKQLQWIFSGTVAALLPFGVFYVVPFVMDFTMQGWMEASVLSLVLLPLSFGSAITKFQLSDVDLIFRRGIAYVVASSAVLAFYITVALFITRALAGMSAGSGYLLMAASALVLALLFAPLKERIQDQLDRYFYRGRYGYRRSFQDFGRTLGSEINLSKLTRLISERLEKTLDLTMVCVFLRDDQDLQVFVSERGSGDCVAAEGLTLELEERELIQLVSRDEPLGLNSPSAAGSADQRLGKMGFQYVQALGVRGRVIGFLALGGRRDGDLLNSEDLEMVATLAGYASIAIDNAKLYRSLETKAAELLQLRLYSENVIESINLGVATLSGDGEVTVWNGAMSRLTGIQAAEAVGKRISEILPRSLVQPLLEVVDGPDWLVKEGRQIFKAHFEASEGVIRLVNVALMPFVSYEDVNTGTLLVFDDITEKIRLESQIQQAEKLSSIGLFAAGLAHEVNTPLAGISSYAQMLLDDTASNDPRRELLEKIERQSFRASEIINNLLNFARFSETDYEEVNVNSLMLDTLSLLEHQFKRGSINVDLDLDPTLPKTVGNGGKLQQVFMNLFLNAKDSMSSGGNLRLHTHRDDSEIVIKVADTGAGISKSDIKRIYDPFFTTKSVGKGTGLGLSVSYGIIQEHHGRIFVSSEPGRGTTFTLHFPIKRIN